MRFTHPLQIQSCLQIGFDIEADAIDTWEPDLSWLYRIGDDLLRRESQQRKIMGFSPAEGNRKVALSDKSPNRNAKYHNATMPPLSRAFLDPRYKEVLLSRLGGTLFRDSAGYSLIAPAQLEVILTEATAFNQLFYHFLINTFIAIEVEIRPFQPEHSYALYKDLQRLNEINQGGKAMPAIGISIQLEPNHVEIRYLLAPCGRNNLACAQDYAAYSIPLDTVSEHLPSPEHINMIAMQALSPLHNHGNN